MKKFSKVLESQMNEKFYKIEANVELIVKSTNEGEAGYLADSILGGIKEQFSYNIINIEETQDRINENFDNESDSLSGREIEEEIKNSYKREFGDRIPKSSEKAEWYHKMRTKGFDGILIYDVMGDEF